MENNAKRVSNDYFMNVKQKKRNEKYAYGKQQEKIKIRARRRD